MQREPTADPYARDVHLDELDFDFILPARQYGAIERLILAVEDYLYRENASLSEGAPVAVMHPTLFATVFSLMDPPQPRKRDTRDFRLKRAFDSLLKRTKPDLELEEGAIWRTEHYMQPFAGVTAGQKGRFDERWGALNPAKPGKGYLGQRIDDARDFVDEELQRIAQGFEPPAYVTEEERLHLHLALAIIGPKILTGVSAAVDAALAERAVEEEFI